MGHSQQFNLKGPPPKIKKKIIKFTGPPPVEVNPIRIAYLRHKKDSDPKLQSRMNAEVTMNLLSSGPWLHYTPQGRCWGGVAEYIIIHVHVIPVEG